jgi:hypothetical protein
VPAAYEKSVFINCPFDDAFQPLFHAIVLTVAARGFTPRSARESEGEADPRIVRIARGLMESKYSIHDLSRYQGAGAENLARFNMPLELGIALGMRYLKGATPAGHNWVAQGNRMNATVVNSRNMRLQSQGYRGGVHRVLICVVFCLFGAIHGDGRQAAHRGRVCWDPRSEASEEGQS